MSTLFSEMLAEEQANVGRKCDLAKALDRMDPDLKIEVQSALGTPEYTAAAISRTLHRYGFYVTEGAVRRCRRTCNCWRGPADAA